jgi:uncharacterized protein YlxW (UPF0749 family)
MSARPRPAPLRPPRAPRSRSSSGAIAVWLIALLIALVATIQLRSQAEVERSLQSADPASLAFSIDLQDAINALLAGGGEALEVNGRRVVEGVNVQQTDNGVTVDGSLVSVPWTIIVIGDPTRLAETADAMTQQLRSDRRVREAAYRVESDLVIRAVISERPFVYGATG